MDEREGQRLEHGSRTEAYWTHSALSLSAQNCADFPLTSSVQAKDGSQGQSSGNVGYSHYNEKCEGGNRKGVTHSLMPVEYRTGQEKCVDGEWSVGVVERTRPEPSAETEGAFGSAPSRTSLCFALACSGDWTNPTALPSAPAPERSGQSLPHQASPCPLRALPLWITSGPLG